VTTRTPPTSRTRNALIGGGAGLVLVGCLIGFGIGRASVSNNPTAPAGQFAPGAAGEGGRPNFRGGERPNGPPPGFNGQAPSGGGSLDQQPPTGDSNPT
jgi:hypothetical protein